MNKYLTLILTGIICFTAVVSGQVVSDDKKPLSGEGDVRMEDDQKGEKASSLSDTSRVKQAELKKEEEDTLKIAPITSRLYWYDLENRLSSKNDSSRYEIFRLADEIKLIYTDMSDIFRNQPLWFDFDLKESGRPAYISMINTYPHQTPFFYGGILMNDQLQGQYNSQFIPLNFIQFAETDIAAGNLRGFGLGTGAQISITSPSIHFRRPWTKIVYKQGSYGYSDVDISFQLPISSTFSFQLGGLRKLYDGAIAFSGLDAENYRAEFTWQYSPALYIRGQLFLDRSKVGLTSFDERQEIVSPKNDEHRDDYFLDITWLPDDSTGQRLHLLIYHTWYARKFSDFLSTYTFETKSKRYGIDGNYNFFLGSGELLLGAGILLPQIFGDPFKDQPSIPSFNTYAKMQIPFSDRMKLVAKAQLLYMKDFDPDIIPSLGMEYHIASDQQVSLNATYGHRFPNATERFFDFDSLYGNKNLEPERYLTFHGQYRVYKLNRWHLQLDGGYHRIEKEIVWSDSIFQNSRTRDFIFFGLEGSVNIWKFDFALGGQYTMADMHLTPKTSIWGQAHFHDDLLSGALILDAYGTVYYYDRHQDINYQPRLDRFYAGPGQTDAFYALNWKIVATVQTARIFFEMDNALSEEYQFVSGYKEFFRRFRLGVNWLLWD